MVVGFWLAIEYFKCMFLCTQYRAIIQDPGFCLQAAIRNKERRKAPPSSARLDADPNQAQNK